MMKSPQQTIYDAVFKASRDAGFRTFDFLPAKDEAYPFVYVGEQFDDDTVHKTVATGELRQTVHIYHTHKNRGEVSSMIGELKRRMWNLGKTEGLPFRCTHTSGQMIPENTAGAPLLHGIVEAVFKF